MEFSRQNPGVSCHSLLQGMQLWSSALQADSLPTDTPGKPLLVGRITTNKASGSDGIPAKLFQILKDDALKVPASLVTQQ